MIHRIKNIADSDERLKRIMEFQRKVLAFVCDLATPLAPDEQVIRSVFKDEGDWVWGKLRNSKGERSDLGKYMEQAIKYCHDNPTERKKLLSAFDRDIKFHENKNINNPKYKFQYTVKLKEATREAIKPMMVAFYTDLLSAGYPEAIQGQKKSFNRDEFIKAFYAANTDLRVCPACDGPRADTEGDKTYADADHFLPKSKHPFLSVHPYNLVPLCLGCNRSFKGDRDSIDDPNLEPLLSCFHPYCRPAIDHIDVQISRSESGERQLQIIEKNGDLSRRVKNLNRVFRLETRWPDRLKDVIDSIVEELSGAGDRLRRDGASLDTFDLRTELESMLQRKEKRFGRGHWYVLHASYLRHTLQDTDEFEELRAQFLGP